jgi:hypothetical protein
MGKMKELAEASEQFLQLVEWSNKHGIDEHYKRHMPTVLNNIKFGFIKAVFEFNQPNIEIVRDDD